MEPGKTLLANISSNRLTEVRKKVIQGIVNGIALIAVGFVVLGVLDTAFGQPRRSNGQFAPMRTTQFVNLLIAIGVIVLA